MQEKKRYFHLPRPKYGRSATVKVQPTWKRPETEWASKLRNTARYQKLRLLILTARPLCVLCGELADQIHHIDSKDPELFFAASNLVPICERCHEQVNSAYRRGIAVDILFPEGVRLTERDLV